LREHIFRIRSPRLEGIRRALKNRTLPGFLPCGEAVTDSWRAPTLPEELKLPGIETSSPVSISSMMIRALNPGPEGERATGYLDDDEDSGGHSLADTVQAALNRKAALEAHSARTIRSGAKAIVLNLASCLFSCIASEACTWILAKALACGDHESEPLNLPCVFAMATSSEVRAHCSLILRCRKVCQK
jgi:hypothetical protein